MLFTSKDIESKLSQIKKPLGIEIEKNNDLVKISGIFNNLHQAIGEIKQNKTIHFVSSGSWSTHDLLRYVLNFTGKADVVFFSWSVSMPAATQLLKLKNRGMFKSFRFLLNINQKRFTAEVTQFLKQMCDEIKMMTIHAKGFILSNDDWKISVTTSGNFSNNQNLEAGMICTIPEVYEMHSKWVENAFVNGDNLESVTEPPQMRKIDNDKILFLIFGAPGSGKNELAQNISDEQYSADDYFITNGVYVFAKTFREAGLNDCYCNVKNEMEQETRKISVYNYENNSIQNQKYERLPKCMAIK